MNIKDQDYWYCRLCSHRVSPIEYYSFRHDLGCPRCDVSFENYFLRLKREKTND